MITVQKVPSHRDFDITQLAFNVAEVSMILGFCTKDSSPKEKLAAGARVRRLIAGGQLRARQTGAAYIIPGSAIAEYLDGRDGPIKHPDSA